jgi:hypothetical protein
MAATPLSAIAASCFRYFIFRFLLLFFFAAWISRYQRRLRLQPPSPVRIFASEVSFIASSLSGFQRLQPAFAFAIFAALLSEPGFVSFFFRHAFYFFRFSPRLAFIASDFQFFFFQLHFAEFSFTPPSAFDSASFTLSSISSIGFFAALLLRYFAAAVFA